MITRRKLIKLAAPALILSSREVKAAFSQLQSNSLPIGYPTSLDVTKTFLKDQNGNPISAIGDDASDLWVMLSASQIEQYLVAKRQSGVNIIWVTAVDNLVQSNPEANIEGDFPFSSAKSFTGMASQTAYWNKVKFIGQRCLVNQITMLFMPVFIGLSPTQGYFSSFYNLSSSTIQNYAAFLVSLLGSLPNIIWLLGGDSDPANTTAYGAINTLAVAIKALDSHLMTMEATRFNQSGSLVANGGMSSVDGLTIALGSVPSWLDINWIYNTYATTLSGAQRCYPQGYPCIGGEFGYELETSNGVTMTSMLVRVQGWFSILGGGILGSVNGNGAIWSFNASNGSPCCTSGTPSWQSQLQSVGYLSWQLLWRLLKSRSWYKLVPDIAGSVMTANTGGALTAVCGRTSDAISIICYSQVSQTLSIDMSKITDAGSQVKCWWYDVTSGNFILIGIFANSGIRQFITPGLNNSGDADWTLILDSNAAALPAPGQI